MAPSAAAPQGASLSAILWNLQACFTEPARIIHCCTRVILRRLLFNRGTGRETASATGTEEETVEDAAVKGTGTAEKESPAAAADDDQDCNQHQDNEDDSGIDYAAECGSMDDDYDSDIDYAPYLRDDAQDNLRSQRIGYYGDSINVQEAYSRSRYLVELLAVTPCFRFVGNMKLYASDSEGRSFYYCSSEGVENERNLLDSKGNLILHTEDGHGPLQDNFYMEIKILDDNGVKDDGGLFTFTVDPDACNRVITRTFSTAGRRNIWLTFIPMHTAIRANVKATLHLMPESAAGTGGNIYHVYGEITARHEYYNRQRVTLFSHMKENKAEVVDGKLPLSRDWAAVPIVPEPVLTVALDLHVLKNHDNDGDGGTVSFRGEVSFYHDQFEKIICSANHGEVKVQLEYCLYL